MSDLECFRATVAHQPHDEFLFYAGFTEDLQRRVRESEGLEEGESLTEHFGMWNSVGIAPKAPEDQPEREFSGYYEDIEIPEEAYLDGNGVLHMPGSMYHFTHRVSPLRNAETFEDLEEFPWHPTEGFDESGMAEDVEEAHENGRVTVCWIGHIYENAWQVRGYEQFLEDMILRPEWCEFILDKFADRHMVVASAAARAGVDYLRTGDDVANQKAMMFSPDQWYRFIGSRWEKIYAAAREIKPDIEIWYHSDGNLEAIIPRLIDIGVTILNPVQPECMDPLEIKDNWGEDLVLDGTIGTQSTMPWGTPEDVRELVRERARTLGQDGGLILSPTHVLEPEVPIENIRAFVEASRALGK